jgi:hypothetical protein
MGMVVCGPGAPPVVLAQHGGFDVAWLPGFFDKQVAPRPSRPCPLDRDHAWSNAIAPEREQASWLLRLPLPCAAGLTFVLAPAR